MSKQDDAPYTFTVRSKDFQDNTIQMIMSVLTSQGNSVEDLAHTLGCTRQNLYTKFNQIGNLKESDIRKIASCLGYDVEINFVRKGTLNELTALSQSINSQMNNMSMLSNNLFNTNSLRKTNEANENDA